MNFQPKLKLKKKMDKLIISRRDKRLRFIEREIISKEYYEDCAYHPCKIVSIDLDVDEITGTSLFDGTGPRSCSLFHCGVEFLTESEAFSRLDMICQRGLQEYARGFNFAQQP